MTLTDKTIIGEVKPQADVNSSVEILVPTFNLRINDCGSSDGRLEQEWIDKNTGKGFWIPVKRVWES